MQHFADIRCPAIEATGNDPYQKYLSHQIAAKRRGVEFEMTFPEWWDIWKDRFAERGPKRGQYVMARHKDEGGYRTGNVRITTAVQNVKEAVQFRTQKLFAEAWEENPDASDWLEMRHSSFLDPYKMLRNREAEEA